jgi:hypothetical protein
MKRLFLTTVAASAALTLGGCATLTRTPNTAWQVNTFPMGAMVETSNGHFCEATPCTIGMPRRSNFTATISRPGYKTQTVAVTNHLSPNGFAAFLGNAVIGGVPGASIDLITGSTLDLYPNTTMLHMERDPEYYKHMYGYDYWADPPNQYNMKPGDTVAITRF